MSLLGSLRNFQQNRENLCFYDKGSRAVVSISSSSSITVLREKESGFEEGGVFHQKKLANFSAKDAPSSSSFASTAVPPPSSFVFFPTSKFVSHLHSFSFSRTSSSSSSFTSSFENMKANIARYFSMLSSKD